METCRDRTALRHHAAAGELPTVAMRYTIKPTGVEPGGTLTRPKCCSRAVCLAVNIAGVAVHLLASASRHRTQSLSFVRAKPAAPSPPTIAGVRLAPPLQTRPYLEPL
ncbi:hypothetical protein E2562_036771 [Oryza meyeriana var. granulata]|uniref:Uncharacterized protein n=1 Tax=Oryza meyeriana var. granulata TaxID=110450 RepID=A0A6G1CB18_9ORYZ|nr:hypothetical protein E2562_036771 [Oryza meyeriana var. granulata]